MCYRSQVQGGLDHRPRGEVNAGPTPSTEPADASWGERYLHIDDSDYHELSFAKPL